MNKENRKEFKTFSLTNWAVDNGISIFLLAFMIMLFGISAYQNMPKEQFPEASLPTVFVTTPYFGNSASDIENLISRPIEKEILKISGVKDVSSSSMQDFSMVTAEFEADQDSEVAMRKVKDAVDLAMSELPNDLPQDPLVDDINFSEIPIMTINLSGAFTMDELRSYAEYLEEELEDIDEVSQVDIKGALEREVKVDLDLIRMQGVQVTFQDIENAIASENMNMSGGELLNNKFKRAVRIVGEFKDTEEMLNMIIKSENQRPIYLKDIADVRFDFEDPTSIARADQLPVVSLDVIKRSGGNLLFASDEIKIVLDKAEKEVFPEELSVTVFNDQSVNTRSEVSNLQNSIISGVLLVVLVLLFFLGLRNAMFVGIAIPLSMLTGILILNAMGVSMNIVVLFALILALGLLVDNAIVAVENIYRYMQEGYSGIEAAKYGVGEIAWPIIASTATTLAAFIPLGFWPGLMGEFFYYLPLTLVMVLASSLFVALVINPVFTSRFMNVDEKEDDPIVRKRKRKNLLIGVLIMALIGTAAHFSEVQWLRNLMGFAAVITLVNYFLLRPMSFFFQNRILPLLERAYDKFIRGALHRFTPLAVFFGTFLLLFGAIGLFVVKPPPTEFFPSGDPIFINVFVDLPIGTDIEATNEIMKKIELSVDKTIENERSIVDAVLAQIGENTADPTSFPEPGLTPHKARLTVAFIPTNDRLVDIKMKEISTRKIMENIREDVKGYPGVTITVDQNASGPPTGKPINIDIAGEDINQLATLSEEVITFINNKNIGGIEELKADVKLGKPELLIEIDREAARRYELSTFSIASSIRTSIFGKEVSKFKQGEDEYPIIIRLNEKYRNNVTDLMNQKVTFRNPANGQIVQVPVSTVANISFSSTYSSIKRKNSDRMISVESNILDGFNENEVVAEVKEAMTEFNMPVGYKYEFTGQAQQQAEDMAFLMSAFLLAVFAIFIILVTQFNSLTTPFIIILSVLFSLIGVFLGYVISGSTMSIIFSGIGIVSLAGVVVNNAIVLIDYINLLIKQKREKLEVASLFDLPKAAIKEAIIKGGAVRLRPVLLTAITTILGLIPLAVGLNINFFTLISELNANVYFGGDNTAIWGPMAKTVIYGLVFATFLTLVVVPVMYWLFYRFNYWIRGAGKKNKIKSANI